MYTLKICNLYHDLLNIYGDRGNIIALDKRASWHGINSEVHNISIGDKFDSEQYDIIMLGGGQDFEQAIIQKDLVEHKMSELRNAIENGKSLLAICGGYQMLGKYYKTPKGEELKMLNLLDFYTESSKDRLTGNIIFYSDIINDNIVGFENHGGRTFLGEKVSPLGNVLYGNGNNGTDKLEGAIYKNVIATYSHGCLLPKNPKLTDYIITTALKEKYKEDIVLNQLDDNLEVSARNVIIDRLLKNER